MFIVFEQLPDIGATTSVIRKVAVVPKDFVFLRPQTFGTSLSFPWGVGALKPANPAGTLSMADHVMNLNPANSQFLSASDRAFAAGTIGVVFTVIDLALAGRQSVRQNSLKPITAEVIRQIGGWGGAIAGAKIGAVLGAACGIETGPGAIVTGAAGALIFGVAGYLGADLLADQISPN